MTVQNWILPHLEAQVGAWRRFWVLLVAFPNLYEEIFRSTPLEQFCLHLGDKSMRRLMMDAYTRAQAKKEKRALKALQNGANVRDIPGSDVAITSLRLRYSEILDGLRNGVSPEQLPHLVERLSAASVTYTFFPDLQPRVGDQLLGIRGRKVADKIASFWLSLPPLEYLNQEFHPLAQHYRIPFLDEKTQHTVSTVESVVREPRKIPGYGDPHAGTHPSNFPYIVSYIGPTPPVPDWSSGLSFPEAPLVQFPCTVDLFDADWTGCELQPENPAQRFENPPAPPFERAYNVNSLTAWVDLVTRYPLEFTNPLVKTEFQRLSGKDAIFLGIDWEEARKDYDVIHFCFQAVLECADVGVELDAARLGENFDGVAQLAASGQKYVAMMYQVVPGSTVWLNL
ncbi:hypothetical protein HMPREF0578_1610 [Mobiluncus mulieris 28-1]|uniref:hypothetical protein n=1 Tax=Mobiluncus mulieris TaxID=2052 RepID=UPI0001BE79BA|nr:hypothetical protein [Mobiluncus mulieris]EEZ92327.1 hypothetical protein HMPREF0578_1610 [Mobiluncus mulieris 28-1]MCV0012093.1 DNA mismatch repair protein MutL [Mobiluncus mulieris]